MKLELSVGEEQEFNVLETESLFYEGFAAFSGLALGALEKEPACGDVLEEVLHAYGGSLNDASGDHGAFLSVVHRYAVAV